jgi:hypothetical protein
MTIEETDLDRIQRMEGEIEALKAAVTVLQRQWEGFQRGALVRDHPVEILLRQRGLPVFAHGDRTHVLLPVNASALQTQRFYALLRRYSFRLFLRDLLQFPSGDNAAVLSRYCSPQTARSYLHALQELGVVTMGVKDAYTLLPRQVSSFGPTLEWMVSEILQREFLAPALFNVRLEKTRCGGDYDVIALLEQHLLYVEAKSSPPRGVELPAVSAFLDRLEDLQPHVAVFFVDTELRMQDKIVALFKGALEHRYGQESENKWPVVRLVEELFHIRHGIYLMNSQKGSTPTCGCVFAIFAAGDTRLSCLGVWP